VLGPGLELVPVLELVRVLGPRKLPPNRPTVPPP